MGSQIRKAIVILATLVLLLASNKYTCYGAALLENNGNASTFSCQGRLVRGKCLSMGEEMEYLEYMVMDLSQYSSSRLLFTKPQAGGGSESGYTSDSSSTPSCGPGTAYGPCMGGKKCPDYNPNC